MTIPILTLILAAAMNTVQPPAAPSPSPSPGLRVVSVTRIWDAGTHNAFTDLVRWRGRWYCTFREGDDHVGGDGRLRVLTSADGDAWTSAALLDEAGVDLRDPKLSVTPDDRLMIVAGGSVYEGTRLVTRQPRVAFSRDGEAWSAPRKVLAEGEWLWRVTWHDGVAWGVSYNPSTTPDWTLTLVTSRDGETFSTVPTDAGDAAGHPGLLAVDGRPNETTLRFLADGTMLALVRREGGDRQAWLGRSAPPYARWSWAPLGHRIGGPDMIEGPDGTWWAAGRAYGETPTTVVARLGLDGTYAPVVTLPSGGDTSYPGLVWHDGQMWMSYYSSHDGRAAVYLARLTPADPAAR